MDRVVTDAYVKRLAKQHGVSVTNQELEDAIRLVRDQNRLGSNDQVFEDVLKEFWGWSVNDFKRELKQQMLAQKVVSTLDQETHERARQVYDRLQKGEDFAALAKEFSDDTATRDGGGDYGVAISQSDRGLPAQLIDELFRLKPGETSQIINTGAELEIIRLKELEGNKVRAMHITFTFKPIDDYTNLLKSKEKQRFFISQ
jgi:hypothetical protein